MQKVTGIIFIAIGVFLLIWGRNIADKFYLTNAVDVQGFGFDYRHVGTPRMYGFDAHYHF